MPESQMERRKWRTVVWGSTYLGWQIEASIMEGRRRKAILKQMGTRCSTQDPANYNYTKPPNFLL